ncbi:MAG: DNA mismatch repair protein MutS [Alphaproteobacteria bacterium]
MQQFLKMKTEYTDSVLFFRIGDFYELFFEDAKIASKVLDITLTSRGYDDDGKKIPLAGIPFHSYEPYLQKLLKSGYKVAIAEQTETPEEAKKRGYKAVVNRKVVRVVSPGTITEEVLLENSDHNFLMAIKKIGEKTVSAWADLSTGHFFCETSRESISDFISRIQPSEIILSDAENSFIELKKQFPEKCFTELSENRFIANSQIEKLKDIFKVKDMNSFGDFSNEELKVSGLVADYIYLNSKSQTISFQKISRMTPELYLQIDGTTRRSLELTISQTGEKKNTLFSVINWTKTAGGKRLLKRFFDAPLTDLLRLKKRQDYIGYFIKSPVILDVLKPILMEIPDLERILSRLSLDKANPRDLGALKQTLSLLPKIATSLQNSPFDFSKLTENLSNIFTKLKKSLQEELPYLARSGNFIRSGFSPQLDTLHTLSKNGESIIEQLRQKYILQSKVQNLKIKQNNVIGYYIEIQTKNNGFFLAPENDFIHKQTMAKVTRFTTTELIKTEQELQSSREKSLALEIKIFENLCEECRNEMKNLLDCATKLSSIDVFSALARLAISKNYTRPILTNESDFEIIEGRHPVVENFMLSGNFIENDCILENKNNKITKLWLITGPNMAGKSTFLRQNALIGFMAQIGSFVPAKFAKIGIIDKIFSRVGASDNLSKGHSTFMTEMIETATILNQATEKSFVILDEIGRGTATFDGLSIAWAVVEHLHNVNKSRGLFATHYHEITKLSEDLPALSCHTSSVKEWNNEIIFMHKIENGSADKSYGIHVAKLAGLPRSVLQKAKKVLAKLENKDRKNPLDLHNDLFATLEIKENTTDERISKIENLDLQNLTPKQALDVLYDLKS